MVRNQKSRCQQGWTLSKGSNRGSFLASSSIWWLQAFLGLWLPHSNLCLILTRSSAVSNQTLVLVFRPMEINQDNLIMRSLSTSAKALFPNKVTFMDSTSYNGDISLEGPPFTLSQLLNLNITPLDVKYPTLSLKWWQIAAKKQRLTLREA